jgi:hypothetical protein
MYEMGIGSGKGECCDVIHDKALDHLVAVLCTKRSQKLANSGGSWFESQPNQQSFLLVLSDISHSFHLGKKLI